MRLSGNSCSSAEISENILQFRLEATRDAQKMSRIAFLASTIVSMAIILATWNAYYSWYTDFPLKEDLPKNAVTREVHTELIKQWVDGAIISLPFLGINVGVSDGPVFGSIGLLIINIWFFLSISREDRVIYFLLRDTEGMPPKSRLWIYHGIVSYMMFTNIAEKNEIKDGTRRRRKKYRLISMMQAAFKVLVFLPPISILFLIISDILTIFVLPAFYRYPHTPLFEHLGFGDAIKLTIMEALAFSILILIITLCIRILSSLKCTINDLKKYEERL